MWDFLKLHVCDSDFLNHVFDRVVLICFPKQCHPLWHGERWWCSVSEKHILLFQNFVLSGWYPLYDLMLGFTDLTGRRAVTTTSQLPPTGGIVRCMCLYRWEHGCLRTYALWVFEGGRALLGCLSDPELNSQIMSLYILNEISWHAVSRDRIRYWATLKK